MLDAARAYASIGWKLFPIDAESKRPLTPHGYLDASSDELQVEAWWGPDGVPDAWIGLALRPSGLIAVDVDVDNGKGGMATLARLEAVFGPLPRELVQQSGRGGLHIVMADPSPGPEGWTRTAEDGGEIRGKADKLGLGKNVDYKVNGYVLLEPSGAYRWLTPIVVPPAVPERWLAALRKPAAELGEAPGADGLEIWQHPSDDATLPLGDRDRLRAELKALGPRARGGGTTFAAVLRIFHDYGLSVDDGYPFLLEWNAACGAPRPEHELHRQIRNIAGGGLASGSRGNRRSDLSAIARVVRASFDWRSVGAAPELTSAEEPPCDAPPADVPPAAASSILALLAAIPSTPPAEVGSWPAALDQAAVDVVAELGDAASRAVEDIKPMFESAAALFRRAFPSVPWIVDSLLTANGTHVLAGEAKSVKTWCATEIALALVTATPAFGRYAVSRPHQVAYFFAEDGGPSVQARIHALAVKRAKGVEGWEHRLHVQPRGRAIDLTKDVDIAILVASCRQLGQLSLLVLDPLRDIHSGEEDSADAMKPIMERLRAIGKILNCAVMFVHHSAKASADSSKRRPGQRMRGSSAIHGSVDCGIYLWDLRGDGKTEFVNAVTSEVKGARSAGTFDLALAITDNRHGVAEKARWEVTERAPEPAKSAKGEDVGLGEVLNAMFNHGAPMLLSVVKTKTKGNAQVLAALIAGAKRDGLVGEHMTGTTHMGFVLTDKGRELVRLGNRPTESQIAPAPHPATAAICDVPKV